MMWYHAAIANTIVAWMLMTHLPTATPAEDEPPLPGSCPPIPNSCYSPNGTDCSWYSECLDARIPCSAEDGYATNYGPRFCNAFSVASNPDAERVSLDWMNGARRCVQLSMVSLLNCSSSMPTCDEVVSKAIRVHMSCYLTPIDNTPSICNLPSNDFQTVFWTIKESYDSGSAETSSMMMNLATQCVDQVPSLAMMDTSVIKMVKMRVEFEGDLPASLAQLTDNQLVNTIMVALSDQLSWSSSPVLDWIAVSGNREGTSLTIEAYFVDRVSVGLVSLPEIETSPRLDELFQTLLNTINSGFTLTIGESPDTATCNILSLELINYEDDDDSSDSSDSSDKSCDCKRRRSKPKRKKNKRNRKGKGKKSDEDSSKKSKKNRKTDRDEKKKKNKKMDKSKKTDDKRKRNKKDRPKKDRPKKDRRSLLP